MPTHTLVKGHFAGPKELTQTEWCMAKHSFPKQRPENPTLGNPPGHKMEDDTEAGSGLVHTVVYEEPSPRNIPKKEPKWSPQQNALKWKFKMASPFPFPVITGPTVNHSKAAAILRGTANRIIRKRSQLRYNDKSKGEEYSTELKGKRKGNSRKWAV